MKTHLITRFVLGTCIAILFPNVAISKPNNKITYLNCSGYIRGIGFEGHETRWSKSFKIDFVNNFIWVFDEKINSYYTDCGDGANCKIDKEKISYYYHLYGQISETMSSDVINRLDGRYNGFIIVKYPSLGKSETKLIDGVCRVGVNRVIVKKAF